MNQSFYIGAVGAQQQLQRLNVHGDNISNVNTNGFKANRAHFSALIYQDHRGALDGADTQLPMGVGANLLMTSTDFSQGGPADTGRTLDYMIEGEGFFGLVDLATGEVTFTRNGAFYMSELQRATGETDENGRAIMETVYCLGDGAGRFVLSETGGLIEISDPKEMQPIGIFDYANYNGMQQLGDTRYLPVDKNGNLSYGTGVLRQGLLERSNADLAEELTKVIESQRAYGMALKMVQTSDEIETTINNLRN